jgi:hypothetical protein
MVPGGIFIDDARDAEDDGIWGWDDTQLVGVSLEPDGELRDVSIANEWKNGIAREELAHVVFAAYNAAERERLDRQAVPADADGSGASGVIPEVPVDLTMQVLAVMAEYTETYAASLAQEQEFRDPDGNVTVTARGGSVSDIRFDDQRLGFTSGAHIAAAVREPLARAVRTGREIDDYMQRQYPEVVEFNRLQSQRSAALLRR